MSKSPSKIMEEKNFPDKVSFLIIFTLNKLYQES